MRQSIESAQIKTFNEDVSECACARVCVNNFKYGIVYMKFANENQCSNKWHLIRLILCLII